MSPASIQRPGSPTGDRLKRYLDDLVTWFEQPAFIDDDPIAACHGFSDPHDQEVIGLFSAILAWGRRETILSKVLDLCHRMQHRPFAFVKQFDRIRDGKRLRGFKHRTFTSDDAIWLIGNLRLLLSQHPSVESIFAAGCTGNAQNAGQAIQGFSERVMQAHADTPPRLQKHLARPLRGSAAKRLCMYMRWMVRPGPVDLGVWTTFPPSQLMLPLDVHSGRQARALGVLTRTQNDWKAAQELTRACQILCPADPARYDYAFFGLGINGGPPPHLQPPDCSQR